MMTLRFDPAYAGGANSGPVTSKREGDLSVSYGSTSKGPAAGDADLSQTTYGRELMELGASTFILLEVAGEDEVYVTDF